MSKFNTLNKDVLLQVAEEFGVGVEEETTKAKIIAALLEDGVTWEMYKESFPDIEDIPDESAPTTVSAAEITTETLTADVPVRAKPEHTVLLKMERMNPMLQIRGYTFRRDHPFVPVAESDAEYILTHEEGFKIAMPSEAEEFYK